MNTLKFRLDAPEFGSRHVSSLEELDALMSNLHDYPFDLDEAEFDQETGIWRGTFFRPLPKSLGVEKKGIPFVFYRWRVPVARALVCVKGLADVRIIADQGIGIYSFNEVRPTTDGIRLRFNEALEIDFNLAGAVDVTYDEDLLPGVRAVSYSFLIVETGPKIVEVPNDN